MQQLVSTHDAKGADDAVLKSHVHCSTSRAPTEQLFQMTHSPWLIHHHNRPTILLLSCSCCCGETHHSAIHSSSPASHRSATLTASSSSSTLDCSEIISWKRVNLHFCEASLNLSWSHRSAVQSAVWGRGFLSIFYLRVRCQFETCLLRTGRLLGRWLLLKTRSRLLHTRLWLHWFIKKLLLKLKLAHDFLGITRDIKDGRYESSPKDLNLTT